MIGLHNSLFLMWLKSLGRIVVFLMNSTRKLRKCTGEKIDAANQWIESNVSRNNDLNWLLRSCYITPLYFFLWDHVELLSYSRKHSIIFKYLYYCWSKYCLSRLCIYSLARPLSVSWFRNDFRVWRLALTTRSSYEKIAWHDLTDLEKFRFLILYWKGVANFWT